MLETPSSRYFLGILPWYSVLIVCGIILAIALSIKEEKRRCLPKDTIIDLVLILLPAGILGARIYYVAFNPAPFLSDPLSVFRIWEGGLAIYGGLIGGFLAVILFAKHRHLSFLTLCDVIVPGVALAQSIGRWGNYFNMEAYGARVLSPSLQFFPFAVCIPMSDGPEWYMATFFYESVWDFCVFLFLFLRRKKYFRKNGDVFWFYLFLYGAGRLIVEDFRSDSLYASGAVRISQLISVLLCVLVVLIMVFRLCSGLSEHRIILLMSIPFFLYSFPILSDSLKIWCPVPESLSGRFLFLSVYSILGILTLLFLYHFIKKVKDD